MAKPTRSPRRDRAREVAFDPRAPQDERTDALGELHKAHAPKALSDLLFGPEHLRPVIDAIRDNMEEQAVLMKARGNVVPFPSKNAGKKGMQSVYVDDMWLAVQVGDYFDKPGNMGFDSLRLMVEQTPVLNAVVMTRVRQMQAFCRVQEQGRGPGFEIRHVDRKHQLQPDEETSIRLLTRFFQNSGWEFKPRQRKRLRRDSLPTMMGKLVRDTLTMDSCAIETEFKRDKTLGIDGMYAVDGATIRLVTEDGYQGDDEIFALQVVQGRIRTAYTFNDIIYEPRNPRSDVLVAGYGLSETELLIRVVTGFLNAMTLNIKGFSDNSIPRGVLHLTGNYEAADLAAFKRYWNGMVRGVNNAWTIPVMVSKDQESKAGFENFGVEFNEMYFAKWMTFLTSIICALYGMDPQEINFESFSASKSSLSGSDTAERLAWSHDKGLRPLLSYFENLFTDYVVAEFSEHYVFRWTGLDDADDEIREKRAMTVLTVDEMRAEEGYDKMDGPLGAAPVNPALIGPWMQVMQAQQPQDFGQPEGQGDDGQGGGVPSGPDGAQQGDDAGGDDEGGQDGQQPPVAAPSADWHPSDGSDSEPMRKAAPAPDYGVVLPTVYEVRP